MNFAVSSLLFQSCLTDQIWIQETSIDTANVRLFLLHFMTFTFSQRCTVESDRYHSSHTAPRPHLDRRLPALLSWTRVDVSTLEVEIPLFPLIRLDQILSCLELGATTLLSRNHDLELHHFGMELLLLNCMLQMLLLAAPLGVFDSVAPRLVAFSDDSTRPAKQSSTRCAAASDLNFLRLQPRTPPTSRDTLQFARAIGPVITDLHTRQFML